MIDSGERKSDRRGSQTEEKVESEERTDHS